MTGKGRTTLRNLRTVTMLNWRRPELTRRALEALDRCRGREDWQLLILVDATAPESPAVLRAIDEYGIKSDHGYRLKVNETPAADAHQGATAAAHRAMTWAFEECGSEMNFAIEDDCLLSPDALELADWFWKLPGRDQYLALFLSLAGRDEYARPLDVCETTCWECGWCFAMLPWAWERWVKPTWNQKVKEPHGWDWQLSYLMVRKYLLGLYAWLPRARNIGRENGVHTQAGIWDATLGKMEVSNGSHGKDYRIASRWDRVYREYDWMRSELALEAQSK